MDNDEIKKLILQRAYSGAFEDGVSIEFNLHEFAEINRINNDLAWKAFDELQSLGLIKEYALGGWIAPTSTGLLYSEKNRLIDMKLFEYQNNVRLQLLLTLNNIQERSQSGNIINWMEWIKEAGVSNQDFSNNEKIMSEIGLIRNQGIHYYSITLTGKEIVRDYKMKNQWHDKFEKLLRLEGITEQQRGHELENLLADIAVNEKWSVNKRVRSQGQEIDIILHVGLHYFLCSCKWEKNPIQPNEVELLESRVRSRATANGGILFSMSGFTDNCVEEMRFKISSCLIIPFGPDDINKIFHNETTISDMLDQKIDQTMNHRKILVDDILR